MPGPKPRSAGARRWFVVLLVLAGVAMAAAVSALLPKPARPLEPVPVTGHRQALPPDDGVAEAST